MMSSAETKFSPTPEDKRRLVNFFLTNGPSTLSEIVRNLGWYREKANWYVRIFDCNVVGFLHERPENAAYARPSPLFAFDGDHIGGYCLTCRRKLALVPEKNLRGSVSSVRRVREKDCRSCRMLNVNKKFVRQVDRLTGEVAFETPIKGCDPFPTMTIPGSEERIEVLSWRVQAQLELWNPGDLGVGNDFMGFLEV